MPGFLFDLDGTLVDSVYQHVLAWQEALEAAGIELAVWRIHRRIGMSGGLLVNALLRETGRPVNSAEISRIQQLHTEAYRRLAPLVRVLPGARELLSYLTKACVPWAIATSGRLENARPALELLGIGPDVTVVTRDQVQHAKPDPDLFVAAAAQLGAELEDAIVVLIKVSWVFAVLFHEVFDNGRLIPNELRSTSPAKSQPINIKPLSHLSLIHI